MGIGLEQRIAIVLISIIAGLLLLILIKYTINRIIYKVRLSKKRKRHREKIKRAIRIRRDKINDKFSNDNFMFSRLDDLDMNIPYDKSQYRDLSMYFGKDGKQIKEDRR